MKNLAILFLLLSCSQVPVKKQPVEEDLVTLRTALDQAQMSYLKACVEAFRDLKIAPTFDTCRERALVHRAELNQIMEQEPAPLGLLPD